MNLETFKARARRKLELPVRRPETTPSATSTSDPVEGTQPPAEVAPETPENTRQDTAPMTPTDASTTVSPKPTKRTSTDRFAEALLAARATQNIAANEHPAASAEASEARQTQATRESRTTTLQSLTGSPARRSDDNLSEPNSEAQLRHLRSLLLGQEFEDPQTQVDVLFQRTQASINSVQRDMDSRLDDLTRYVTQLEQSIVNGLDDRTHAESASSWALLEETEARLDQHDRRLNELDVRLTDQLTQLQTELNEGRAEDRAFVSGALREAEARTDKLLAALNEKFEHSVQSIESNLSAQLATRSEGLQAESSATVERLREQLGNLIDERVRAFNSEQSAELASLRDAWMGNMGDIKSELIAQTANQKTLLTSHRKELEQQFNLAIETLQNSKVSHRELSQLLGRLADRVRKL